MDTLVSYRSEDEHHGAGDQGIEDMDTRQMDPSKFTGAEATKQCDQTKYADDLQLRSSFKHFELSFHGLNMLELE